MEAALLYLQAKPSILGANGEGSNVSVPILPLTLRLAHDLQDENMAIGEYVFLRMTTIQTASCAPLQCIKRIHTPIHTNKHT